MADRMATQTYCRNIGGKGSSGNKLVTKSELSTYGCKLVSNPSKSYANNQCVAERDIEKAATLLQMILVFDRDQRWTRLITSNDIKVNTTVTYEIALEMNEGNDQIYTYTINSGQHQSNNVYWTGNSHVVATTTRSHSPSSIVVNGVTYELSNSVLLREQ